MITMINNDNEKNRNVFCRSVETSQPRAEGSMLGSNSSLMQLVASKRITGAPKKAKVCCFEVADTSCSYCCYSYSDFDYYYYSCRHLFNYVS